MGPLLVRPSPSSRAAAPRSSAVSSTTRRKTIEGTPAALGLAYEDVEVTTEDGVQIHGWLVPGPRAGTLLYCHGNAGNISHRLSKIEAFHNRLGLSILIFDYRGLRTKRGSAERSGHVRRRRGR